MVKIKGIGTRTGEKKKLNISKICMMMLGIGSCIGGVLLIFAASSVSTSPLPQDDSYDLAAKESMGFFTDIPETAWRRLKERFQLTQPNYNTNERTRERHTRYSNYYFAENFEPEFTCLHEERFGGLGDGGKWICDPHRIVTEEKPKCLVYSVGCNGKTQFEGLQKTAKFMFLI